MATNILSNNTPTNDQKNVFDAVFCDIYYCHKIHCSCKKCHHLKMSVWWPDHGQCWTYSTWLEFNVMLLHWFITYNNTGHDEGSFDQDYAIKVYVKSFICLLKYLSLPWLSCNLPIRVIYEEAQSWKIAVHDWLWCQHLTRRHNSVTRDYQQQLVFSSSKINQFDGTKKWFSHAVETIFHDWKWLIFTRINLKLTAQCEEGN